MGKLRSPEEVQASREKQSAEYLAHAEDVLSELIGKLFGPADERVDGTEAVNAVRYHGMGLRQLVMAYRRYPTFDPSCLITMKEFKYTVRVGGHNLSAMVFVPKFGVCDAYNHNGEVRFDLLGEQNCFNFGTEGAIRFDHRLQGSNREALKAANLEPQGWSDRQLRAIMPKVPADVRKRMEAARPCFDRMSIVWEAEWSNAPVVDPLIIGHVLDKHFLVDQYDVTKLERYVSSEMTRPPLK